MAGTIRSPVFDTLVVDEAELVRLAELVALKIQAGDVIALSGDLGAGKSTFARALIRAALADPGAEVPSPTFSLVQSYATARVPIIHADLYRLTDPQEARELGLADSAPAGCLIVEWPERGPDPAEFGELLLFTFDDIAADPARRRVTVRPHRSWLPRVERLGEIWRFIATAAAPFDLNAASITYLQGDASPRAYARIRSGRPSPCASAILMDAPRQPDGPPIRDGKPYSRIAHLAEDVKPFVAIGTALWRAGLSAPMIYDQDLDSGLLLIEDFGEAVFGQVLAEGGLQADLWRAATDVLVALRHSRIDVSLGASSPPAYVLPAYDRDALAIETELLLDWYVPAVNGAPAGGSMRTEFTGLWDRIFSRLLLEPSGLVLRDYHSPNLMWLARRTGVKRVGLLDFQDAMSGPWAYDLVSLLQDARLDVPASLEMTLLGRYADSVREFEPEFDGDAFSFAYAAFGAQRNTKILGIFARLARRDGKNQYLIHVPRIWGYLERNLAHPELRELRAWYDLHLPIMLRSRPLAV